MKLTLPPRIAVGFAAAILAVVASALATARSLAEWRDFRAQVTHTFETRNALQRTMLLVRDAESGQRGFVLTGREHYLGQYLRARENLEPTLARVRELTLGDDPQEGQIKAIEPLIRQRFAFAERVIELRRTSGLEVAVDLIESGEGVRLMAEIENRLEAIRQEEREILERKQQEWSRSNVVSTLIFAVGDVVLVLLVVLAAKLVRDELRERERREEERARMLEMQKHLMGIVGHDLRSPLAAIHTSAELLVRSGELPEKRLRTAQRIVTSSERMEHIIRDLLDFARVHGGRSIPVHPAPADIAEICRRVVEELQAESPGREVHASHEGETAGQWDAGRLEQLVSNLLSNALKHGDPSAPVRLRTRCEGERLTLEVHNRGPPIPGDLLPQIFEPFKRGADASDFRRSVGLGLFIVRSIAEAHGGRVEVSSSAEAGTTFRVSLPMRVEAATLDLSSGRTPPALPVPPSTGGGRA